MMNWLAAWVFSFFMGWQPSHEMICAYTELPIIVDASLGEDAWSLVNGIRFLDRYRKKSDNMVTVKALWNESYLYIAFRVQDKNLQAQQKVRDHPLLYMDDMVEWLIDPYNAKDSCWGLSDIIYHINLLGVQKDDRGTENCITNPGWNGQAKCAVRLHGTLNNSEDCDTGYTVEVALPWSDLEVSPYPEMRIGINFGNGDEGRLFDWVGASPFRSPYAFGVLVLQKSNVKVLDTKHFFGVKRPFCKLAALIWSLPFNGVFVS